MNPGPGRETIAAMPEHRDDPLTSWQLDIRRALAEGELVVHYQPIVDLRRGRPVAAEALVRWAHPELGLLAPIDFVPFAQRCGLAAELTDRVLELACAQVGTWSTGELADAEIRVAVNVSPLELCPESLVPQVRDALAVSGVDPAQLILEITEADRIECFEEAADCARGLGDLGVSIALDDFGTGHSSLQWVKQVPADVIKLDKTFTRDLAGSRSAVCITGTSIGLGRQLGAAVVVEGVETEEQLRALQALGCSFGQGYHFAPPLSAEDFEAWIETWQPAWIPSAGKTLGR